ncbi:hypothetical protein [Desulfotruncus alcoholivorax]|uniref:hypothetical protein n=1 Tax=Desulfotruncus alcoholivorax TaxID=265477 RepID=UPI000422265B|nr:hypothetical protein [Desulfotruncus alcoholivorax]
MSCSSLKHRFEKERRDGITFERAMEIYQDVDGSIAAHKTELTELMQNNQNQDEINHLRAHIEEGEKLLQEIKSLYLH